MKTLSTYQVDTLNTPVTTIGHSITISTTIFGTEEEVEYLRKNCEETIGSGLIQDFDLQTSRFSVLNQGKVVPDIRDGWRYEE